jgi:hypothetical protein
MSWFLNTSWYVPRVSCGQWTPLLVVLYVMPSVIIALASWWIPFTGILYWKEHREGIGQYKNLLLWYAAFIFVGGTTHLFDILVFKWPYYNLSIVFLNVAAILSLKAAWHTRSFVQDTVKLPSRRELHDAINNYTAEKALREIELIEKTNMIQELKASIARLNDMIETRMWIDDRDKALQELTRMLEQMRK